MRLTRKCKETPYTSEMYDFNIIDNKPVSNYDIIQKLGQLEDIEDELGIDLITLFKALNNSIYIKENYDGTFVDRTLWSSNCIICGLGDPIIKVDEYAVYTKDYGKTWALKKEELK